MELLAENAVQSLSDGLCVFAFLFWMEFIIRQRASTSKKFLISFDIWRHLLFRLDRLSVCHFYSTVNLRSSIYIRDMRYKVKEKEIMIVMRWDAMRWMMRRPPLRLENLLRFLFRKITANILVRQLETKHQEQKIHHKISRKKMKGSAHIIINRTYRMIDRVGWFEVVGFYIDWGLHKSIGHRKLIVTFFLFFRESIPTNTNRHPFTSGPIDVC